MKKSEPTMTKTKPGTMATKKANKSAAASKPKTMQQPKTTNVSSKPTQNKPKQSTMKSSGQLLAKAERKGPSDMINRIPIGGGVTGRMLRDKDK